MAESGPSLVGRNLGKYRLLRELGRGGMGVVYEAHDTLLDRTVALKVLSADAPLDARERFIQEARAAVRLSHPNVASVYDIADSDGQYAIAMELLVGSVHSALERTGIRNWHEATRWIAEACRGLAAAHAAGILHRDIKPGNILLTLDGHAKLGDFGLVKLANSGVQTQTGRLMGTPSYMSPEQCQGDGLDARSDLYSLGAAYYTLLTGEHPFTGATDYAVMYAHCSRPAPDPRERRPDLPPACAAIVMRAMAKRPDERYASATEMAAALDELLASSPESAEPSTIVEPAAPVDWHAKREVVQTDVVAQLDQTAGRRHTSALALAAVITLALTGLALWSVPDGSPPGSQTSGVEPGTSPQVTDPRQLPPLVAGAKPWTGHTAEIGGLDLTADGVLAVTASLDQTIRLWRVETGDLLQKMTADSRLKSVAFCDGGRLIAAGGVDGRLTLWRAATGEKLQSLDARHGEVHAVAASADGSQIATGGEGGLRLWQVRQDQVEQVAVLAESDYMVTALSFAADGRHLASTRWADVRSNNVQFGPDAAVSLWRLSDRTRVAAWPVDHGGFAAVAFNPASNGLACGLREGQAFRITPLAASSPLTLVAENQERVFAVDFDRPGQWLAWTGAWDGKLQFLALASGKRHTLATGVNGGFRTLRFLPDGRRLLAGSTNGELRIFPAPDPVQKGPSP